MHSSKIQNGSIACSEKIFSGGIPLSIPKIFRKDYILFPGVSCLRQSLAIEAIDSRIRVIKFLK